MKEILLDHIHHRTNIFLWSSFVLPINVSNIIYLVYQSLMVDQLFILINYKSKERSVFTRIWKQQWTCYSMHHLLIQEVKLYKKSMLPILSQDSIPLTLSSFFIFFKISFREKQGLGSQMSTRKCRQKNVENQMSTEKKCRQCKTSTM